MHGLIGQREGEHRAFARSYNVLFSIYGVADRAARIGTPKIRMPQGVAGLRVERYEVAIHSTPEDQAPGGGEHAGFAIGDHLEVPLLLPGLGIDGADGTVAFSFRLVIGRRTHRGGSTVDPGCSGATPRNNVTILHTRHRRSVADVALT